ncbi:PadR family transcriptional regulator [Planctomonas deserti]|uniref:PadR family transcriptional regulator n=1 Tax=Planctomonas deserti TaxID=2144185 RepID=UPI000D3B6BB8|nr:PadR family transcriptional regulator [Planctomonas deserti]
MSRSDQTRTAVLGALSIQPMSGYALREEIVSTLGHFWSESFGQIYPALARLEGEGLVERRDAGSRSSTFAITRVGTEQLRTLLAEPPQIAKPRNGVLLRLFFGRQLGPDRCRELVRERRESALRQLAELARARAEVEADASLADQAPYILLTVSAGEHSARATVAWADEATAALDGLATRATPARAGAGVADGGAE